MKKAIKFIVRTILVIVFLMVLLVVLARTYVHVGPYKSWEDHGIGVLLPSLSDTIGESADDYYIKENSGSNSFHASVYGISKEDFNKYVDAVMESGFTVEYDRSDDRFSAGHITIIRRKNLSMLWFEEENSPYKPPYMSVWLS